MRKLIYPFLAVVGWLAWACDSGNPVAPSPPDAAPAPAGVTFTLGLSISPSQLIAGSGVPGTVTVTAKRNDNDEAPDNGTLVTLSTDMGDFGGSNGDLVTLGLSGGSATASLFPTATTGTATLLAQLSDSSARMTVDFVEGTSGLFITAVEPRVGGTGGGTRVQVRGGGFVEPLTATFGGGQGSVVSVTPSIIVVDTPPPSQSVPAGQTLTVDVTVNNALGSGDSASVTLAGGFIYAAEGATFVTAVDPSSGPATETQAVTVSGGGFQAPVQVDFGGRPGTGATVIAGGTAITVTAPASAQTVGAGQTLAVNVTVTSGLDQQSPQVVALAGGYTYLGEDTVFITAVDPSSSPADEAQAVTVSGGGFQAPVQVDFGGRQGTGATVSSDGTEIMVTAPASSDPVPAGEFTTVDVEVTSGLNQQNPQTVTLTGGYTYEGEGTVFVTSVSPSSGPADEEQAVTVSGGGFQTPVQVDFGGKAGIGATLVAGGTEITVTAPTSSDPVPAGDSMPVDVKVTSGQDQQTATLTGGYTYLGDAEVVVSAISPTSGSNEGGTTVTVTGQGFADPVSVELNGVRQQGPNGTTAEVVVSSTTVRFSTAGIVADSCPASGQLDQMGVTVTNLATGASGSSDLTFSYTVPAPRINQVSPTSGFQSGGFTVQLFGEGFQTPARVTFDVGGEAFTAVVLSVSGTLVQVTAPSVPNSVLPESDCTDGTSSGKRYENASADVKVINLDTGCEDTFGNAFTYVPTDTTCRLTAPPPPP